MKRKTINRLFIVGAMVMTAAFFSCEEGPDFRVFDYPSPIVDDFSPKEGYAGEDIVITGSDFGTAVGAVKVYFGAVLADTVRVVEDNRIVVRAPDNGTSGILTIHVFDKQDTTTSRFTFLPKATIIGVSSDKAEEGDELTITGENFGTDIDAVEVFIGGVKGTVIAVETNEIKFMLPDAPSGNIVLHVGRQQVVGPYLLVGMEKLSGTLIGHSGSWGNDPNTTIAAAVDGDLATFIDGPSATGYVGYDLGDSRAAILKSVRYAPRASHPARMVGGEIRGANDPALTDYVVLHSITEEPPTNTYTEVAITDEQSYRYIYYYSPSGNCNIAEIEFYGNVVERQQVPGQMVFEFNTDGDNEGWKPQQGAEWNVADGALNVTFTQLSGNKRSDLALLIGGDGDPVTIHTGNYPIFAIKMNKPEGARITFDTNMGSFGNGFNKYETEFATQDVYYWNLATLTLGGTAHPNEEITFTSTFQLKIADIPEDDPATGYSVQWIRTFESKEALAAFISN